MNATDHLLPAQNCWKYLIHTLRLATHAKWILIAIAACALPLLPLSLCTLPTVWAMPAFGVIILVHIALRIYIEAHSKTAMPFSLAMIIILACALMGAIQPTQAKLFSTLQQMNSAQMAQFPIIMIFASLGYAASYYAEVFKLVVKVGAERYASRKSGDAASVHQDSQR